MISKKEIFDLIDAGELNEVFEQLNNFFRNKNNRLNALIDEFINPPSNFSLPQFVTRLQVFVTTNYQPSKTPPQAEIDYYDLLCDLNFTKQTENFQSIYPNKNIAAFLLHGETDEEGNDLNWLCKKLLYKGNLNSDLIIDLSSIANGSYECLLHEFYVRFGVVEQAQNKTKPIVQLRSRIEEKLENEHLVCIIKSPESLLDSKSDLGSFFEDFLRYLDENIDKEKCAYTLILLFIDAKQSRFPSKDDNYFLQFNEGNEVFYLKEAIESGALKIIDLGPINSVNESDIEKWIIGSMKKGKEVFNKISCYRGREKELLYDVKTPYQVITKICTELKVTINSTWKI